MKAEDVISTNSQGRKRPIALLDMDHTLVYTVYVKNEQGERITDETGELKTENVYNVKLLNKLKAHGIRDVYLFTDMTISKTRLEDRLKLIKFLEEQAFTVHGVITPLDFFWNFDTKALREFEDATLRANIVFTAGRQKNIHLLDGIIKRFTKIIDQMNRKEHPSIGVAFREATEPQKFSNPNLLKELQLHGNACKHAIDVMSLLKEVLTCKGIMFMQFIAQLPRWASAIYVFDDIKENNEAVNQFKTPPIPVYTVDGEFSANANTFAENTKINPEDVSPEARLTNIAKDAFFAMESLRKEKTLGSYLYKTECQQALNLLAQVQAAQDSFEDIFFIYITHFKKISKAFFGSYQLSALDKCLLQLIIEDEIVSKTLGINPLLFSENSNSRLKDESYQKLLEHLLLPHSKGKKNLSTISLHESNVQIPKLPTLRSSGNIPLFSSGKNKEKQPTTRITRRRSFSDTQPSLDVIPLSPKTKANSQDPGQLETLTQARLTTDQQLKTNQVLTVIAEDSEDSNSDSEPVLEKPSHGSNGF